MRRRVIAGLVALLLALAVGPGLALGGGWAVTSVDGIPAEFQAGETYSLTYTVRQHGQTPIDVDKTFISAWSKKTGETAIFYGEPTGETGTYAVEVNFPSAVEWEWEVQQGGFGRQSLGTVRVIEPTSVATAGSSGSIWTSGLTRFALPAGALALIALLALQGTLLLRDRREPRSVDGVVPAGQAGD